MKKSVKTFLSVAALLLLGLAAIYHEDLNTFAKLLIQQNQGQGSKKNEEEKRSDEIAPSKKGLEEEAIVQLTDEQIKKHGLATQTAAPGQLTLTLATRGKIILDPDRVAHVFPKISGIAKESKKSVGDRVKEGEEIALIESREMADLKAAYLAAASKEKLAASTLQREESLHQKHISSGQDYLNALNSYEEAKISLLLASQKLQGFEFDDEAITSLSEDSKPDLHIYAISAPIDGTVIKRHLTKGEYVDDETLIFEIADLSTVLVEMAIYPKDLHRISAGQKVEVRNLENLSTGQATLIYVSPIIEDETITAKALAKLDNPQGKWRPGSMVGVDIAIEQVDSPLMICSQAVQKMDGSDCAFVQTEKGFEKRELKLGRSNQGKVEVLSGLVPGDRYVSENPFLIKAEMNKDSAKDED